MIVRTWHGAVPIKQAEGFRCYLLKTGIKEAKVLSGNKGAYMYSQQQGEYEHFFMVSYWENIEALVSFSGPNPHIAVTYPEDSQYGLISDPIVLHHEVETASSEFPLYLSI